MSAGDREHRGACGGDGGESPTDLIAAAAAKALYAAKTDGRDRVALAANATRGR